MVARTEVLRGEAGHRRAEAVERRHKKIVELVRRAEAVLRRVGDHFTAKRIELHDDALHHDDADGKDRELQSERNALNEMSRNVAPCDAPVLAVQSQLGILQKGIEKAAERADELRRNGGDGCACDAPVEREDEEQIQPHVEDRREKQERERRGAVAHAAQARADEVIEKLRADAAEEDGAVGIGRAVDLPARGRDVDPREHGVEQRQRQRREHGGQRRGEDDLRRHGAANARAVARADKARRHGAEARARAEGELQEDHRERGGVVHTGDLARRQRLTDNGGVADGIDLLEQVGNDNGEREHEQRLPARSLREVHGLKERTKRKRRLMIHKPHLLPRCILMSFIRDCDYKFVGKGCQCHFCPKKVCASRRIFSLAPRA